MDTPPWPPHQDSAASGDPAGSHPPQTPPPLTQGPETPPEPVTYRLRFTGYGDEYFRIYFVNVLLTLITFGFYVPWARVRTRQYFYANTWLAGHPFEYLAKPRAILRGYLIVVAAALANDLAGNYDPIFSLVLTGLFFLIFPWIIYKTLRFKARYAAWRNIRFRFLGKLGGGLPRVLLVAFGYAFYPIPACAVLEQEAHGIRILQPGLGRCPAAIYGSDLVLLYTDTESRTNDGRHNQHPHTCCGCNDVFHRRIQDSHPYLHHSP